MTHGQGAGRATPGRAALHPGSRFGKRRGRPLHPPWAEYPCDETETCTTPRDHHIRGLLVTGVAAPGDPAGREQVRQAMKQVAISVRPITNALVPPPAATVPADTKVLIGTGGSGDMVREAWTSRWAATPGSACTSPRHARRQPGTGRCWGPSTSSGTAPQPRWTALDGCPGLVCSCPAWPARRRPRSGSSSRANPRVTVATFGRDKQLPWVAYTSPVLPAGSRVERVVGLDSAGSHIGHAE